MPRPTSFCDGFAQDTQWTAALDLSKEFNVDLASPLNVAFGGEYRREGYAVGAGVPLSYEAGGAQSYQASRRSIRPATGAGTMVRASTWR